MQDLFNELRDDLNTYQKITLLSRVFSHSTYDPIIYSWSMKNIRNLAMINLYRNVYEYTLDPIFSTFKQLFIVFKLPPTITTWKKQLKKNIIKRLAIKFGEEVAFDYSWSSELLFPIEEEKIDSDGNFVIPIKWFYDDNDGFPLFMTKSIISFELEYEQDAEKLSDEKGWIEPPKLFVNYKKKTQSEIDSIKDRFRYYKIFSDVEYETCCSDGKFQITFDWEHNFPVEMIFFLPQSETEITHIKMTKNSKTIYDEDAFFFKYISQICSFGKILNDKLYVISFNDNSIGSNIESSVIPHKGGYKFTITTNKRSKITMTMLSSFNFLIGKEVKLKYPIES